MEYEDNCLDLRYPLGIEPLREAKDVTTHHASKEAFLAYETVRQSGLTNMWDIRQVGYLADELAGFSLTREDVLACIKHYDSYAEQWLDNGELPA